MIELDKDAMPQKTNLDALREMSVEETAQIVGNPCKFCYHDGEDCASCRISVDDNDIVTWLNSPVEEMDPSINLCNICEHQETCIDGGIDVVKTSCSDFKCVEVKEDE